MGDGTFTLSDVQWAALELVTDRAAGAQATRIVNGTPFGDAAITAVTARALAGRRLITMNAGCAWPSDAGRRVLATRRRIAARRAARSPKPGPSPSKEPS